MNVCKNKEFYKERKNVRRELSEKRKLMIVDLRLLNRILDIDVDICYKSLGFK